MGSSWVHCSLPNHSQSSSKSIWGLTGQRIRIGMPNPSQEIVIWFQSAFHSLYLQCEDKPAHELATDCLLLANYSSNDLALTCGPVRRVCELKGGLFVKYLESNRATWYPNHWSISSILDLCSMWILASAIIHNYLSEHFGIVSRTIAKHSTST